MKSAVLVLLLFFLCLASPWFPPSISPPPVQLRPQSTTQPSPQPSPHPQISRPQELSMPYGRVLAIPLAEQLHAHKFEVNLHFPDLEPELQRLQLHVQELKPVEVLRSTVTGKLARYVVTARVPLPFNLAPSARHLRDPFIISVQLETSTNGQTWQQTAMFHVLLQHGDTRSIEAVEENMALRLSVTAKLVPQLAALAAQR